jgi:hypothetical protein
MPLDRKFRRGGNFVMSKDDKVAEQGDQIGRIFASWAIVYFVHF